MLLQASTKLSLVRIEHLVSIRLEAVRLEQTAELAWGGRKHDALSFTPPGCIIESIVVYGYHTRL